VNDVAKPLSSRRSDDGRDWRGLICALRRAT